MSGMKWQSRFYLEACEAGASGLAPRGASRLLEVPLEKMEERRKKKRKRKKRRKKEKNRKMKVKRKKEKKKEREKR